MRQISTLVICSFLSLNILKGQICSPPSAYAELNIGNCRVGLMNGGDMWWDGVQSPKYEVPKVNPNSGIPPSNIFFTGSIWLSALDNQNNLKLSGMTYRVQGYEFYPGPLSNTTGQATFGSCTAFDRFFEITQTEITAHNNLTLQGLPIPAGQIASNITEWPALGNTLSSGYVVDQELAPFHDYNMNGVYDPENGDYPKVIGDQSFFWVLNDNAGFHQRFGGDPLNVEIHCLAHAFTDSVLMNSTIYEYTVINKSFGNLNEFYFSFFADPEIGGIWDDGVGCDTSRNLSFYYKTDPTIDLPFSSIQFLNQSMSSFNLFINSGGTMGYTDPVDELEARNRMTGKLSNGLAYCMDGDQVSSGCPSSNFMFPGNPANPQEISICSSPNVFGNDARTLSSVGPLNLNAWEPVTVAIAVNSTFPMSYNGCPDSENELGIYADEVANQYSQLILSLNQLPTSTFDRKLINEQLEIVPNPANNYIEIKSHELDVISASILSVEGKVIARIHQDAVKEPIDVSNWSSGLYFIHVQTAKGNAVKRLIKH